MDEGRVRRQTMNCPSRSSALSAVGIRWRTTLDNKRTNHWLGNLLDQQERNGDFQPTANLCIRTDIIDPGSALCMSISDLAHTCLSNYFSPYRDAASVTWISRDEIRQYMLTAIIEHNSENIADYISNMQAVEKMLSGTDAVLYVSRDARSFMSTHNDSFLDTLAMCLRTTRERIIVLDMSFQPSSIV